MILPSGATLTRTGRAMQLIARATALLTLLVSRARWVPRPTREDLRRTTPRLPGSMKIANAKARHEREEAAEKARMERKAANEKAELERINLLLDQEISLICTVWLIPILRKIDCNTQ